MVSRVSGGVYDGTNGDAGDDSAVGQGGKRDNGGHPAEAAKATAGFRALLTEELNDLFDLLVRKNDAYGNSALEPVRVFSKVDATEQLKVRIDDKLARLIKGTEFADEDTVTDLLGYLVLLKMATRKSGADRTSEAVTGSVPMVKRPHEGAMTGTIVINSPNQAYQLSQDTLKQMLHWAAHPQERPGS